VIARTQGVRGGPPLAVLRIPSPDFPLAFSIGPENVMIPSMQFTGAISLSARLDEDGNAMTRGAGDISSPTVEPLSPGATGIKIVLSEQG
jgi:cytochrome c-type biogenesis protein CcmH